MIQKRENINSIFLWGSRFHGCEREDSDYDYIIIVQNCDYFDEIRVINTQRYDLTVIHKLYFDQLWDEHLIWIILLYFYPQKSVMIENENLFDGKLFNFFYFYIL